MDDGGFSSFFREVYPQMVGQLRLLTGDLASAEDVAQEAFVRAASRWRQLVRYDQPEAWVRKTAFRLAIDLLRRAARHQGLLARLGVRQQEAVELPPEDRAVIAALQAGRGATRRERRDGQVAAVPRPGAPGRVAARGGASERLQTSSRASSRGGTACPALTYPA